MAAVRRISDIVDTTNPNKGINADCIFDVNKPIGETNSSIYVIPSGDDTYKELFNKIILRLNEQVDEIKFLKDEINKLKNVSKK